MNAQNALSKKMTAATLALLLGALATSTVAWHGDGKVTLSDRLFAQRIAGSYLTMTLALTPARVLAQPAGYFSSPKPVPGIPLLGQFDFGQTVTADGRVIVFQSNGTLYEARRSAIDQPFTNALALGPTINHNAFDEGGPTLTADGLVLIFSRDPPGQTPVTSDEQDLFEARRASVDEPFAEATPLPDAINRYSAFTPNLSPDGLTLLFSSARPGGKGNADIWVATRASRDAPFGAAVNFDDFFPGSRINTAYEENGPSLSSDALTIFFADLYDSRPGSGSGPDIWVATRPNSQAPFGPPENLNRLGLGSALNQSSWDGFVFVSRDWPGPGSKLYFSSNRRTEAFDFDFWEAAWVPFRLTSLQVNAGELTVNFNAKPGRSYDVQFSDQANGPTWMSLGRLLIATNDSVSVTAPLGPIATQRYYRVVSSR